MTPADARHLRRMLMCITAMKTGVAPLVEGADSLLFLRDALEEAEETWADELTSHIATLESAGLATADQRRSMGPGYGTVVSNSLAALETMVRSRFPGGVPPDVDDDDV